MAILLNLTNRAETLVLGDAVHTDCVVGTRVTDAIVNVHLTIVTSEPVDTVTCVVVRRWRGREVTRPVVVTGDKGARVVHLQ